MASSKMEAALLVLLCSYDPDIVSMSAACIGELCQEADLTGESDATLSVVANLEVYKELASTAAGAAGRAAQQKRVRKLLKRMTVLTVGNWNAWMDAHKRWVSIIQSAPASVTPESAADAVERRSKQLMASLKGSSSGSVRSTSRSELTAPDEKLEWQHYAGFMCALAGISAPLESAAARDGLVAVAGRPSGAAAMPVNSPSHRMLLFIEELLEYLVSESVVVRESVRDIIGIDLSPQLYPMLFNAIRSRVDTCFTPEAEVIGSDRNVLLVDQAVSLVRMSLERMTPNMEGMMSVDIESLILMLTTYLSKMSRTIPILRTRNKACQLLETLMSRTNVVAFRQEIKFRNKVLELVVDWTSDFGRAEGERPDELRDKLSRDLDIACMKAIVALLYQLPLQPDMAMLGEGGNATLSDAKANLFYRYFSFLTKVMNRCRVLDSIDRTTQSGKPSRSLHDLLQRSRDSVRDLGPLRDAAVLAMSHLLSANIESGLKYSLSMGYDEDPKTRTAFMHVLTNILNQGTEFNELAADAIQERYAKLIDLLVEPTFAIVLSLCDAVPAAEMNDLAQLLLNIFETRGCTLAFLVIAMDREVARTHAAANLFRGNSMVTKITTLYFKSVGSEYLSNTLQPAMNLVPTGRSFEVDPAQVRPDEDVEANLELVRTCSRAFLDAIIASEASVPPAIRDVLAATSEIVQRRFPGASTLAVGGLLILRFIGPALAAPEVAGLLTELLPKDPRHRGMRLIAKVVQNVANQVLFGSKELFLVPLNAMMEGYIVQIEGFLNRVAVGSVAAPSSVDSPMISAASSDVGLVARVGDADLALIHMYLAQNIEHITREAAAFSRKVVAASVDSLSTAASATLTRPFDLLNTLLAQLGPPPERLAQSKASIQGSKVTSTHQLFHEFMRRNESRNVDAVKSQRVFYTEGVSKERRPVYYFIARKYVAGQMDEEMLLVHAFQTLKPALSSTWDLIIDSTMYSVENNIPTQWIMQFIQLLPYDILKNLKSVIIYNPSNAFKKAARRLATLGSSKEMPPIVFAATIAELHEHVAPNELRLPKSTVAIETDIAAKGLVFTSVNKVSHYYSHVPVVVKVGTETVHLTSVRKTEVLGVPTILNTVLYITDIDGASFSARSDDFSSRELTIKYDRGASTVTLQSARASEIAQAISAAKERIEASRPTNVSARVIRPTDVPGTLLNMALLNFGSDDATLRLAAYNLLYSLSVAFNFDVGNQLVEANGLCIPSNNTAFVIAIAKKLSENEQQLTLEFLSEALVGFKNSNMALKHLALEYMMPWLANLAPFIDLESPRGTKETRAKTIEIIHYLIEVTVNESEMYPSLQSKIWFQVAGVPGMASLVVECFMDHALRHKVASRDAEIMADSAVTLASVCDELIAGIIIGRLQRCEGLRKVLVC